jgi:hypothetical protein
VPIFVGPFLGASLGLVLAFVTVIIGMLFDATRGVSDEALGLYYGIWAAVCAILGLIFGIIAAFV